MRNCRMLVSALVFVLSACGTSIPADLQSDIEISAPFAHVAGAGETSAAYMSITNNSAEADTLLGASCDSAMMVQLMESTMEGDVMSMGDVPGIDLPAKNTVELKPGGMHIMLMDLMRELKDGSTINITLEFEKAGKVVLEVPVKAP